MLILLSNLNLVTRIEVSGITKAEQDTTGGGLLQGMWVTPGGAAYRPASVSGLQYPGQAYQIWTESNRAHEASWEGAVVRGSYNNDAMTGLGAGHFSPDAADKEQLTGLYGKYRALTNMWTGTVAAGDPLVISANGFFIQDASFTAADAYLPFGICTKVGTDTTHIGQTYSCIEYVTL
jgi:hypothetical protein